MAFAVGCNKELPAEAPEAAVETVVFTASMDGADSKAVLNETSKYSEWEAGDKVTIHNGTAGFEFTAASAGASTELSYTGTGFSGSKFMAAYPSCASADVEAKTVNAYISTWQQAQVGTYHHDAALAVAYTENNELTFKNATALLKFTVATDNVTHIIFHGNLGEGITGNVSVSLADGTPKVTVLETEFTEKDSEGNDVKVTKKGSWVELYAYHDDDHRYFEKGQTYYIAIAPQTFEEGVTVKIRINEGEELQVKTTTKAATFKANTVYNLGEFVYAESSDAPEWAVAGTFNDWNMTANPMTLENGYYVIKGVTGLNYTTPDEGGYESKTGFKFVHNSTWKGAENVAKVAGSWAYVWGDGGANIYVEGAASTASYDIYLNPNEGEHGKFVIVPAGQAMPEDTPSDTPTPDAPVWAVAGTFNDWNMTANPMTLENGYYVIEGVSGLNYTAPDEGSEESKTGFKFINNGTWKGAENVAKVAGTWAYVWGDNGTNIYVEGATSTDLYDIYLNPNEGEHGKFVIVPTGQAMPEDVPSDSETPTTSDWYVAGTFNSWSTTANPMTLENGFYVLKNVTGLNGASNNGGESSTGFKFVYKGAWKGSGNDGQGKTAGKWEYVWGDNGMNIYVAGASATDAYDIYVNPSEGDHGKFVIVPAGQAMPEDAPSTPETPTTSDWYVAGTFNGWSTTANPMTLENGFYVLKNVTGLNGASNNGGESSTGFKFVYKGAWKGSGNDGQGKTAGQWEYVWGDGGMNIYVSGASAADAYDIYVNPSEGDHGKFVIVTTGATLPL